MTTCDYYDELAEKALPCAMDTTDALTGCGEDAESHGEHLCPAYYRPAIASLLREVSKEEYERGRMADKNDQAIRIEAEQARLDLEAKLEGKLEP